MRYLLAVEIIQLNATAVEKETMESTEMTPPTTHSEPTIVDQNIAAVLEMQRAEAQALTRHQRAIERMVSVIAVPAFLFVTLAGIVLWVGINLAMMLSGRTPWDGPPFGWLQTAVSLLAIVMTSVVVITQRRQGKAAEINAHVDLQINLLVDQKAAKIIQLLEEMRVDHPNLKNRFDAQAEELQHPVDPVQMATTLAEKLSIPTHEIEVGAEPLTSIEPQG